MKLSGNTVLITGGASGIGLAFAERFLAAGSKVIVCGRREAKLQEAKEKFPALDIRACDIAVEAERRSLAAWAQKAFPAINVLVNNAGIQQRVDLTQAVEDWEYYQREIAINLEAPIHLSMLFIPQLAARAGATIINISSGLAFTPLAGAPIYSATKAAMHSFSLSLRHQLVQKDIDVIEVAPPAVNTDLGGPGLHTFGEPLDAFADAVFAQLAAGKREIGYGTSEKRLRMSRDELDAAFQAINNR